MSKQHGLKRSAQNINNSLNSTPNKSAKPKILKPNSTTKETDGEDETKQVNLNDIYDMMKTMMSKLEKLDTIEKNVKSLDDDLQSVKASLEYAHAEVVDLKKDNKEQKLMGEKIKKRVESLEKENAMLHNSIIDLKARSMRGNLIFHNIEERPEENTTTIIHKLLEEKLNIEDASSKVKIDRSHRLGYYYYYNSFI